MLYIEYDGVIQPSLDPPGTALDPPSLDIQHAPIICVHNIY